MLEFYKGKKVFITGHTGFKGSWLCKILVNAGAEVTGYSLNPPTNPSLFEIAGIENDIHSIIGDIRNLDALKKAFEKYKQYDLSPQNLTIYINAEPCIMCAGALMWSGVKTIYFGVPSKDVERITGFDKGYKPNWVREFKKRGITVYGSIEKATGEKVLQDYVDSGKEIYKPSREEKLIGMPNPWTECNTDFKCGTKNAGFNFPLSLSNYKIRATKGMFEISYPLDEFRTVTVRKGFDESNNGDNSGDYNKYPDNKIYTLENGVDINIRGDKNKIYVMYFMAESGVYSAKCKQGMTKREVEGIYNVIREAEEPKWP